MAGRGRPRGFDRDAVLLRAMRVFWENGYEATSVADLTSAMGINSPSLYSAFGSKEALFREAVEIYSATEGSGWRRALDEEPTARAAVEAMLRTNAVAFTTPGRPSGCMIVLAATNCSEDNAGVRDLLAGYRSRVHASVRERIERGVTEGDVPGDADAGALASFYDTVHNGLSLRARDGASCSELLGVVDSAMAAWGALTAR
ncbi:AcrR family transcriptional regulator [Spinactinospora alkalitolerans]|uniref:AcrR family transcriptional regulator n=1 Tax=Spinactinospora alkalitolerans TaxID=687207 RepID=A0A852U3B1_9ACTN|nr:TetR/AcrR family transcriptional regulator [Spinactinospora alkalitolerans]NYE50661.1 AcrR family transcriptional regulator [Spinactinospora alkalitolerans]